MKTFTILETVYFVEEKSPFNSTAIRSISYIGNSQSKFKISFNDDTIYFFDLDEETHYQL